MKIYLNCTANLGDFMNAYPVLSGLSKLDAIDLIIRHEMIKFADFREFLYYQGIFRSVEYDNQTATNNAIILSSWTHMTRTDPNRPVETCRYENWIKEKYKLDFTVDDDCRIKCPELDIDVFADKFIVGDRWGADQDAAVDQRRLSHVIRDGANIDFTQVHFLDYTKSIFENCAIIAQNPNRLISTFTGISIIADLMAKPVTVCWDDDMRIWDGKPVEFDWQRHFYADRNSELVYVRDLKL